MEALDPDVEAKARAMYTAMDVAKPDWDQLGDVTKSVWRERAVGENTWPFKYALGVGMEALDRAEKLAVIDPPRKLTLKERIDAKRAGQQGPKAT